MKHITAVLVCALSLALAGFASAQTTSSYLRTQPMISGTVTSSTEHSVMVRTDDGEEMVFEVDSRSLMPRNLQTGTHVRIDFHHMDNGSQLATRIVPTTPSEAYDEISARTSSDEDMENHDMNTASSTTVTTETMEMRSASSGHMEHPEHDAVYASNESSEDTDHDAQVAQANGSQESDATEDAREAKEKAAKERQEELPKTGSAWPLIALSGIVAIAGGLILRRARQQRAV